MIVEVSRHEVGGGASLHMSIGVVEGIGSCVFMEILVDLEDCVLPLRVVHRARVAAIDFIMDIWAKGAEKLEDDSCIVESSFSFEILECNKKFFGHA